MHQGLKRPAQQQMIPPRRDTSTLAKDTPSSQARPAAPLAAPRPASPRRRPTAEGSPFSGVYDDAEPLGANSGAQTKSSSKGDRSKDGDGPDPDDPAAQIRQVLGSDNPETLLAPEGLDEADQFAYYAALVRQGGGLVNPVGPDGTPLPTVLGIRGMDTTGQMHDTYHHTRATDEHPGGYDDTIVVLTTDEEGNQQVLLLPYSSHPSSDTSDYAPNVDGEGANDMGIIRPGTYMVSQESNSDNGGNYKETGMPSYRTYPMVQEEDGSVRRGDGDDIPAWRDMNHDRRIDEQERLASEGRHLSPEGETYRQVNPTYGDYADGVLFHQGWSAGCQTFDDDAYREFVDRVGDGSFSYTLVDGNQTLEDLQPRIAPLD